MENQLNVQKNWRTRQEKKEIISQWEQSGKSRKQFCLENGITYNSLVSWCKQFKDESAGVGFSEVKLTNETTTSVFAQLHLPGGIKIDFYQAPSADFIRSLLR